MKLYSEYLKIRIYFDRDQKAEDLFFYLERYLDMATVQMQRMLDDEREMKIACETTAIESLERWISFSKHFCDIHFFILCVDKVFKLAKELAQYLNNYELGGVITKYESLAVFKKMRNIFEHMDEKIMKTDWFRNNLSTMINHTLTANGTSVFLGTDALEPLYSFYEEYLIVLNRILEPNKEQRDELWRIVAEQNK